MKMYSNSINSMIDVLNEQYDKLMLKLVTVVPVSDMSVAHAKIRWLPKKIEDVSRSLDVIVFFGKGLDFTDLIERYMLMTNCLIKEWFDAKMAERLSGSKDGFVLSSLPEQVLHYRKKCDLFGLHDLLTELVDESLFYRPQAVISLYAEQVGGEFDTSDDDAHLKILNKLIQQYGKLMDALILEPDLLYRSLSNMSECDVKDSEGNIDDTDVGAENSHSDTTSEEQCSTPKDVEHMTDMEYIAYLKSHLISGDVATTYMFEPLSECCDIALEKEYHILPVRCKTTDADTCHALIVLLHKYVDYVTRLYKDPSMDHADLTNVLFRIKKLFATINNMSKITDVDLGEIAVERLTFIVFAIEQWCNMRSKLDPHNIIASVFNALTNYEHRYEVGYCGLGNPLG